MDIDYIVPLAHGHKHDAANWTKTQRRAFANDPENLFKKITNLIVGFKAFHSAQATIDGIETAHMIRKGQLPDENIPTYKLFMTLAG